MATERFWAACQAHVGTAEHAKERTIKTQGSYLGASFSNDDIASFYRNVEIYPFRQPYNKRFGGFRWYAQLVSHIQYPSILEYGCGSAVLTDYLVQRAPHCRFTVADIPSVTLDFVKWKKDYFKLPYDILTIDPKKRPPLKEDYDLIICQDVLEHTPNPFEIVTDFVSHLSRRGVLVIDFLNAPGGENLEAAVAQRESVKDYLLRNLTPLKAIDDLSRNDGLYIKQ